MITVNENNKVDAREIYNLIGVKSRFNGWITESFGFIDAIEGKDFCRKNGKSTGGRPTIEYELTINCAKELCLVQRNEKSKQLRQWLINLSNQHDTGLAFTSVQIEALMDLSKSMTLVSIQKEVERKHFDLYNNNNTWWEYRAGILGYSKESLIEAMKLINKKYKSIRESLIKLDGNELIRTGVIDLMIALGKTEEYAINVGNLCKSMALKMELANIIWDDTKPNPLGLNSKEIEERKNIFNESNNLLLIK
jgi:phage anti-repressor protein